jgi:RNA recognition motif-containing protein
LDFFFYILFFFFLCVDVQQRNPQQPQAGGDQPPSSTLFVGSLSFRASVESVLAAFADYNPTAVRIVADKYVGTRVCVFCGWVGVCFSFIFSCCLYLVCFFIRRETGTLRGFGYVEFSSTDDAGQAKEDLEGTELDGKPV